VIFEKRAVACVIAETGFHPDECVLLQRT